MSFTEVNGTKLHYQLIGQGEPTVVFLHGLVMDNLSSWFFTVANQASQISRALLYDLRGHGFSDRPKSNYDVDQHVRDLEQLLKVLEITSPVVLVGNSFGGLLALNFAQKFPQRVRGLILLDAQINDEEWRHMMLRSLGLEGDEANAAIGQNFQNWLGRNSSRKSNRLAKNAHELVRETSLLADIKSSSLMEDEGLRKITAPTLALYGGESDIIHVAKKLEQNIPHFQLKIFPGSTHSLLWEKTDEVRSLILSQIEQYRDGKI